MSLASALVIFSYGLFTIAAQSLLFREFITTFEGNDIGVGMFFGSWFLWIGATATLVSKSRWLSKKLLRNIELLFLCYLPAFVVQLTLIVQAREIVGLESYALWSVRDLFIASVLVNAPVSAITGLFFPIACEWVKGGSAVSRVYIIEAMGGFAGGLGVTLLLWFGVDSITIFLVLAAIVGGAVLSVRVTSLLARPNRERKVAFFLSAVVPVLFLACLAVGVNKTVAEHLRAVKWTKLLPEGTFTGAVQTPQAEYLCGAYEGQWVALREGSTSETLPDDATASRIMAISLCQNPSAESVLVVGSGLGLCSQFLRLPQIGSVTWAHPDPDYARSIDAFIPADQRITDSRFRRLAGDIRRKLTEGTPSYDIVVLNLPDATSSVLNRYYTVEFYEQIRQALQPDGVLTVRVTAGENIMGTELINLGASMMLTLQEVFAEFVLAPGEETWFTASNSSTLSADPAVLRDRFAAIEGADALFSADALLSVFLPDRATAALEDYSRADLPKDLLINRDARPLTHLYSLLLTTRQSGAPLTRLAKLLVATGSLVFLIPIVTLAVIRLLHILDTGHSGTVESGFDSTLLVFLAGAVGIGTTIVLMYLYQTYFGSLYLHVGIISSLFMIGLTAAAAATRTLVNRTESREGRIALLPRALLPGILVTHALVIAGIALVPPHFWGDSDAAAPWMSGHLLFAVAFLMSGLCVGCYFPIAAHRLSKHESDAGQTGGRLETADHWGAATGGVMTSLVLVPTLGTKPALFVLALLIMANAPAALLAVFKPRALHLDQMPPPIFRTLGYALFGIASTIVICSNIVARADARLRPSLPRETAQALAAESELKHASVALDDTGRAVSYFSIPEADPNTAQAAGYIFSSGDFAPDIRGFGGKLNLAVYVDADGNLIDFHIVRSNETPSYLRLLDPWREKLKDHCLFQSDPFVDIDTVSGATTSSRAVLTALQDSASGFARNILGVSAVAGPGAVPRTSTKHLLNIRAAYILGATVLALLVTYLGGFRTRLTLLTATCVVGGLALNAQFSMEQVVGLLSLHTPAFGLSGAFLLVVGIPVLVTLFGNVYCGYICPFGAAQELLSYIIPGRFRPSLPIDEMRKARFLKYIVLFVAAMAFFVSRDRTTLLSDPLITVFSLRFLTSDARGSGLNWQSVSLLILVALLVGSLLYRRFWCRYLCPAGAFLSLFNKAAVFRRLGPLRKFSKCEFGLTAKDQLDCIYCDRCRYPVASTTKPARLEHTQQATLGPLCRTLVPGAMVVAVLVSLVSIDRLIEAVPSSEDYSLQSLVSGGKPRDVDLERVEELIRQKRLSDREADFYQKPDQQNRE